jgi:hypothetical protein
MYKWNISKLSQTGKMLSSTRGSIPCGNGIFGHYINWEESCSFTALFPSTSRRPPFTLSLFSLVFPADVIIFYALQPGEFEPNIAKETGESRALDSPSQTKRQWYNDFVVSTKFHVNNRLIVNCELIVICKKCGEQGHADGRSPKCKARKQKETGKWQLFSSARTKSNRFLFFSDKPLGRPKRKSEEAKLVESSIKKKAKTSRKAITRNDDFHNKCPKCVAKGVKEDSISHSSSRSKDCPYHEETTDEKLVSLLGNDYERFVRKISLNAVLKLDQPYKSAFLSAVKEMVMTVKTVMVKGQLFACYYILQHLESTKDPNPMWFTQEFFYACFQLVVGRSISSPNVKLPKADMESVFLSYKLQFPGATAGLTSNGCMNALASAAMNSAKDFTSFIVEMFETRAKKWIKYKLMTLSKVIVCQIVTSLGVCTLACTCTKCPRSAGGQFHNRREAFSLRI